MQAVNRVHVFANTTPRLVNLPHRLHRLPSVNTKICEPYFSKKRNDFILQKNYFKNKLNKFIINKIKYHKLTLNQRVVRL